MSFKWFAVAAAALVLTVAPYNLEVRTSKASNQSPVSIQLAENTAEARQSRSRSRPSRTRTRPKPAPRQKAKPAQQQRQKATPSKRRESQSRTGRRADQQRRDATQRGTTSQRRATTSRTGTRSFQAAQQRPRLSQTEKRTLVTNRTARLTDTGARTTRVTSRTTTARRALHRPASTINRQRTSRSYWRDQRQYDRNRYYSDRRYGGWGYGFYPGYTYHAGWGTYGYGYTRGGLDIVDYMLLYAIFGHHNTSTGDRVVVQNNVSYDPNSVVAVPKGTQIQTTTANTLVLLVPKESGPAEAIQLPPGTTMTETEVGRMLTTPTGSSVLVPASEQAYAAPASYQPPAYAQQPQTYEELRAGGPSFGMIILYLAIAGVLIGGVVYVVRRA